MITRLEFPNGEMGFEAEFGEWAAGFNGDCPALRLSAISLLPASGFLPFFIVPIRRGSPTSCKMECPKGVTLQSHRTINAPSQRDIQMNELVPIFFYGGLINPAVMERVGLVQRDWQVASLQGYRIEIEPWVTLKPRPSSTSYGIVMPATHAELDAVYSRLSVRYFPYPVLTCVDQGYVPALTYLAGPMERRTADEDHILPLLHAGASLGFPDWYLKEISSFLPKK